MCREWGLENLVELEDKNWEKRRNGGRETAEEATVIDSGRIMGEAGLER